MKTLFSVLLSFFVAGAAQAQVKPADAASYRNHVFHVLVWNFAPMGAMVRGKTPFDRTQFALRADRVAALAPQLLEGFPKDSAVGKSEARPEIWSSWPDFVSKMKTFETESKKLAEIAHGTDEAAMKAQFGKVGASCKACHDKYKKD